MPSGYGPFPLSRKYILQSTPFFQLPFTFDPRRDVVSHSPTSISRDSPGTKQTQLGKPVRSGEESEAGAEAKFTWRELGAEKGPMDQQPQVIAQPFPSSCFVNKIQIKQLGSPLSSRFWFGVGIDCFRSLDFLDYLNWSGVQIAVFLGPLPDFNQTID